MHTHTKLEKTIHKISGRSQQMTNRAANISARILARELTLTALAFLFTTPPLGMHHSPTTMFSMPGSPGSWYPFLS